MIFKEYEGVMKFRLMLNEEYHVKPDGEGFRMEIYLRFFTDDYDFNMSHEGRWFYDKE